MPALSPTMTAGNIGTWQKKPGDSVAPGDVLVEIETDKAQMDFEFQEEGTLAKILKEAGEKDVAVGNVGLTVAYLLYLAANPFQPIAVMIEEGEDISAFESFTLDDAGGEKPAPKEAPKEEAAESSEPPDSGSGTAPKSDTPAPEAAESDSTGDRLQTSLDREPSASPMAKKLALTKGVPINEVKGTGPDGRVTKRDIEKYKPSVGTGSAASSAAPTYEDIPASSMRKTIASRLQQSMNENPHYFVSATISVSKLLKLRQALNDKAEKSVAIGNERLFKLSLNDFLIKACGYACMKVPAVNSTWREEGGQTVIRQFKSVDISVAVATPVGLMTPIVRGVENIGIQKISTQVKDLGKRARDGKLKPEEYQGGTFTISNMGMNPAVERFTAVINPPQAGILAVGTTRKVAIPVEGAEGEEPAVTWDDQIVVTASFDHKVVDGAVGGKWIREFKDVVENPLRMML